MTACRTLIRYRTPEDGAFAAAHARKKAGRALDADEAHRGPPETPLPTHDRVEDGFSNLERLHSHLDYVSPIEFELKEQRPAIARIVRQSTRTGRITPSGTWRRKP